MDRGLWRYTRHPNYFGDACVWWGIALVAAETTVGRWGLIGAATMNFLLRRVSGVTLLEKSLIKRRAGYDEYVARDVPVHPPPAQNSLVPTSVGARTPPWFGVDVALVTPRQRGCELFLGRFALDPTLRRQQIHQRLHDALRVGVGALVLQRHRLNRRGS